MTITFTIPQIIILILCIVLSYILGRHRGYRNALANVLFTYYSLKDSEALKKKTANAKPASWLTDGLTKEEIEQAMAEGNKRSQDKAESEE